MKRIMNLEEYKQSRVYAQNDEIFEEIEGNIKIFEKELDKFISQKELMPKFIKYDEQNRA